MATACQVSRWLKKVRCAKVASESTQGRGSPQARFQPLRNSRVLLQVVDEKKRSLNDKSIGTAETADAKTSTAVDKGETLSSDSDEDIPGTRTPHEGVCCVSV